MAICKLEQCPSQATVVSGSDGMLLFQVPSLGGRTRKREIYYLLLWRLIINVFCLQIIVKRHYQSNYCSGDSITKVYTQLQQIFYQPGFFSIYSVKVEDLDRIINLVSFASV